MRTFLIVIGVICYAFGILLFAATEGGKMSASTNAFEMESLLLVVSGTVALGCGGIIGAIRDLRDDTVRLSNIERIEAQQRELAAK